MDQLYQRFVTRWLREHLPEDIQVREERPRTIATFPSRDIGYRIDIVLEDSNTGETICVIDTKHKVVNRPDTDDISQLVGYAQAERTQQAFLVYPAPLDAELDTQNALSDVRVYSLVFPVKFDLYSGGRIFIRQLETAIGRDLDSTRSAVTRDRNG
jgi:5-methylcytosine-specific restriction endonuclease McrBC regulatory subunit McrC